MKNKVSILLAVSLMGALVSLESVVAEQVRNSSAIMQIANDQRTPDGNEDIVISGGIPLDPGFITISPGSILGRSWQDIQSVGSSGQRIALDSQNNIHLAWTKSLGSSGIKWAYYNYFASPDGWAFDDTSTRASYRARDNYPQMSITFDNKATLVYHDVTTGDEAVYFAVESAPGNGSFEFHRLPNRIGGNFFLWPYQAIDRQGNFHVVETQYTASSWARRPMVYTRSTDGGVTWGSLQAVDTVYNISSVIASSPVSNKVAMVYTHAIDTSTHWKNDIYYIESQDGLTWDWANGKVNVTEYGRGGDSLYAYIDLDAIYDYNDNLHIIWNAQYVWLYGAHYNAQLLHYDDVSGRINTIIQAPDTWPNDCAFGAWNFVYSKMSLAVYPPTNAVFAVYTSWLPNDCSAGGYANGELFMTYSRDSGETWTRSRNLTNSHTPDCIAGECDSDHWSSLADVVDSSLHIIYVNDKDPGTIVLSEGAWTENPIMYMSVHNPVWIDPLAGVAAGTITEADNITPIYGAQVSIVYNRNQLAVDTTGADGRFVIGNLHPNQYIIEVTKSGYIPQRFMGVEIVTGETTLVNIPMNVQRNCPYVPGDVNANGVANGLDIIFAVGMVRGYSYPPPFPCNCPPLPYPFFAAGDVNGSCSFNGIDLTYMVTFYKGGAPFIICPLCPPGDSLLSASISGSVTWPNHELSNWTYVFADTLVGSNLVVYAQRSADPATGEYNIAIPNLNEPIALLLEAHDDVNNNGAWYPVDLGDGWGFYDANGNGIWDPDDVIHLSPGQNISNLNIILTEIEPGKNGRIGFNR